MRSPKALAALALLAVLSGMGIQCAGAPGITIASPAHGFATSAADVTVSGRVENLALAQTSLTVNGQPVAIAVDGTWSTLVALPGRVQPVLVEATHAPSGTVVRDRIVVLRGDWVADGQPSPRSLAIRITDDALDAIEPRIAESVDVDPDTLFPPGTLVWEVPVLGNDVRVVDSGLGVLEADIDATTGLANVEVTIHDVRVDVNVEVAVFPDCQATVSAQSVSIHGQYVLSPDAVDPSAIDVAQHGSVSVALTGLDPATNCGGPLGDVVIDLFGGVIEDLVVARLGDLLDDASGGDTLIAATFQDALAGLHLSGVVAAFGEALGVVLSAPLDEISGDPEGAVVVADARITSDVGPGSGQCPLVAGAPDLTGSLEIDVPVPDFGALSPGGFPYSIALALGPSALHQLLKAQVECGLLVASFREVPLGGVPIPLTAGLLALFLDPAFQHFPPQTPFRIDVRPTLAPVVTGGPGPAGELVRLEVPQLRLDVVPESGSDPALEAVVDLVLGLDLGLDPGGEALRFVPGPLAEDRVDVVVLGNWIGADASTVETRLASVLGDPALSSGLMAELSAGLSSFPLPTLLGLRLAPVEVADVAGAIGLFATLLPDGTSLARLAPSDDTTVRGGANAGSTAGGAAEALEVNGADGGGGADADASAKTWLRFGIAPLASEVGAALVLSAPPSGPPPSGLTVDVFGLEAPGDDTWPEASLHWDNADDNGHGNAKHRAIDLDANEVYGRGPLCRVAFDADPFVCAGEALEGYLAQEMSENGGDDVVTFILAAGGVGDGPSVFAARETGGATGPTLQGRVLFVLPTDDTSVRGGANATSTAGGLAPTLEVNGADGGGGEDADASAKSWLRFEIGALGAVAGARLTLTVAGPAPSGQTVDVFGLEAPGDDTWPEESLHWANADDNGHGNDKHRAIDLVAAEVYGRAPLCTIVVDSAEVVCTGAALEGYLAQEQGEHGGDDVVTFVLTARHPGDGPSHFVSKEGGSPARIEIGGGE